MSRFHAAAALPAPLVARLRAVLGCGPDLTPQGLPEGLARHLAEGWQEGTAPAPWFDPAGYEVLSARRDDPAEPAILHYAREGAAAGLDPDPLGVCRPRGAVSVIVPMTTAEDAPRLAALLARGAAENAAGTGPEFLEPEFLAVDLGPDQAAARALAETCRGDLATGRLRLLVLEGLAPEATGTVLDLARAEARHPDRLLWPLPRRLPPQPAPPFPTPPRLAGRRAALRRGEVAPRLTIRCPAPDAARAHRWGDFHFAESLARALNRAGARAQVSLVEDWEQPADPPPDATLLLRGVRRCRPRPGLVNLMWMLSHPDRIELDELARYDHVFVASDRHAETLARDLGGRVSPLLQCADPDRMAPECFARETWEGTPAHPLLFVGNSRRAERWIVSAALAAGEDLAIYGAEWEDTPAAAHVRATNLPNDRLGAYYGRAEIVLNDHWPDMAAKGFLSNRLFDVAMAGGFVISDRVAGAGRFFGLLPQVGTPEELTAALAHFRANPAERARRARLMQALVRRDHSFAHRARSILDRLHSLF